MAFLCFYVGGLSLVSHVDPMAASFPYKVIDLIALRIFARKDKESASVLWIARCCEACGSGAVRFQRRLGVDRIGLFRVREIHTGAYSTI